jgi:hypothetical protein
MASLPRDFKTGLTAKVGFKGFGLDESEAKKSVKVNF